MLGRKYVAMRFVASVAGSLGALTLALGMIGLYGVQSEGVSRRTREFGIRLAIGASAARIVRMVLVDGFMPVLQGLLLGLFFGTLTRLIVRVVLVAPIRVLEPVSFGLVPLPFLFAAFLACYLPARRAACTDPNVSLRHL
jgi:putative ABC transport system permease protein